MFYPAGIMGRNIVGNTCFDELLCKKTMFFVNLFSKP